MRVHVHKRRVATLVLAGLWVLALQAGLAHAVSHHEGDCPVCVAASTLSKSLDIPATPQLAVPAFEPVLPGAVDAVYHTTFSATAETLRGPPSSC